MTITAEELAVLKPRFTPKQQAHLDRMDRAPWRWWTSDAKYYAIATEYADLLAKHLAEKERAAQEALAQEVIDAQHRYFDVINRVTTYDGPDYRIQHRGQKTWIRATKLQYDQAEGLGVERSTGVPESRQLQIAA